jgi:cytochrome c
MENTLFSNAIALQADIDRRAKLASETKQAANDAAYVQMVLFIAGNQAAKIQGGTKKAGQFQSALIEAHNFPKRHAQTVASIALNKKINALVKKGLATTECGNDAETTQAVADILADNELTSVNKLKSFIAAPVDRVAKLLEALAKLDEDELESFKDGFSAMIGEEE